MKTKQNLMLLGAAMMALLFSGCNSPYYDEGGDSGPYYGSYGPYYGGYGGAFFDDDVVIVDGHRRHRSFGEHHISGRSFGGGSHSGSSFSSARSAAGRALSGSGHSGGGSHGGSRTR